MSRQLKYIYPYFPIAGLCLYLIIFMVAAGNYAGGSFNEPNADSYSFFNNFLCDVMDPITKGGLYNPARGLAVVSHIILSLAMISFFYLLPEIFSNRGKNFYLTRYIGMMTMGIFVFMSTSYHDLVVTLTGVLGTFALIPFFVELRDHPNNQLKQLAYTCFILSIVVFFIFETKIGFYYLPFLQKITFMLDAVWVVWVSLIVLRKNQLNLDAV